MGSLIALLLPLVPAIVQGVEKVFVKSESGTAKMDAAVTALQAIADKIAASGVLPMVPAATQTPGSNVVALVPPSVTTSQLQAIVETVFQQLKASGQLAASGSGTLYLLRGGTVTELKTT